MRLMRVLRRPWMRASALGAAAAVAVVVVSACGSSSPASTAPSVSSAPASSAAMAGGSGSGAAGSGTMISTAKGADGTYLVGASGKTVYLWMADTSSASHCSGPCAGAWPPVTTKGAPTASGSAVAKELGMTKRSDGTEQVTYHGHPLYYFAGDSAAGQTNGQSSNGFGARWWIVAPSGSPIMGAASSSGGTAPSSGAYSGY